MTENQHTENMNKRIKRRGRRLKGQALDDDRLYRNGWRLGKWTLVEIEKKEIFIPNEKIVSLEYTSKKEEDAIEILKNISENWDEYWGYDNRPTCNCETCDLHKRTHYFYLPKNLIRPW
jgi:hypothetical protein